MTPQLVWLFVFIALYWAYCVKWGVSSARTAPGAEDFFLASRLLPPWVFVLIATAASFGGWAILMHPSLVMRDGLALAQLGLAAVAIPFAGVLFFKRQWLLG